MFKWALWDWDHGDAIHKINAKASHDACHFNHVSFVYPGDHDGIYFYGDVVFLEHADGPELVFQKQGRPLFFSVNHISVTYPGVYLRAENRVHHVYSNGYMGDPQFRQLLYVWVQ